MTVAQFIAILQDCPQDAEVVQWAALPSGERSISVAGVEVTDQQQPVVILLPARPESYIL